MRPGLFVALAASLLAACGGKNAVEPPAELVELTEQVEVREVWSFRVGAGSERLRLGLEPASDGSRLYAGSHDGKIVALDQTNGDVVWEVETELLLAAGPGVGDGLVVFGTSDGELLALNAETGLQAWLVSVGSEVLAAPVVANDRVLAVSADGRLSTVHSEDGREDWIIVQTLPALTLRGMSAPLAVNGVAIVGFDNGRLAAYDIEDGIRVWENELATPVGTSEIERLVDIGVDFEVFGNMVYAASVRGRAAAIFRANGNDFWDENISSFSGIGVDSSHVYITNEFDAVIALNRQTGAEVWRQEALRLRDVTAAVRFRDMVVVADYEGYLHWLNAEDGSFMTRNRAASAQITAKPFVLGPLLVVQSEDGTIAAFEVVDETAE